MKLNYKKYGEQGPNLIILHGLLGSLDNWHTIARKLSDTFTVYTVDQRNHGRSPHAEPFNYEVMGEDLHEFMEQHQLETAHILGHSMGGKTGMWFAAGYPGKTSSLISVDMAPKPYGSGHEEILEALKWFPVDEISSRKEADQVMQQKIDNFAMRQFLLKNLQRNGKGGYRWKMNLPVIEKAYENMQVGLPADRKYEGPTLFIRGDRSGYIKDGDKDKIRQYFPKAGIATIKNSGHWVHTDAPKAFLKTIQSFLQETKKNS